jgi:poly(A) polymerase
MPDAALARLRGAEWLARPGTRRIFDLLEGDVGRTKAVGGIVRDTLLGRNRADTDLDLATELLPEAVMERALAAGIAAHPTGLAHGTVTLVAEGQVAEVTTLREDVETDGRHALVRFGGGWAMDAGRRDFTLNALYADRDGTLFDPLGGLDDCLAGRVRFVGDPDRRIAEDQLRVLRFFRFSASHGGERFDPEGLAAASRAARSLTVVSAERIGAEMKRMLGLACIGVTLRTMAQAGIAMVPEDSLPLIHRHERRGARPGLAGRLALVFSCDVPARLKREWRLSNDEVGAGLAVLAAARLIAEFRLHEAAYRHPDALAEAVGVAATLSGWTGAGEDAVREQLRGISVPALPIDGADLIARGLAPGPVLGRALERLERLWIESGFTLGRQALLDRLDAPEG